MSKEAKIKILSNLNSEFVNFIIKSNPDTFNLFEISYKFLIHLKRIQIVQNIHQVQLIKKKKH